MVRGIFVAVLAAQLGACSLLLDFSDKAIPKDASIDAPDAPYSADECAYKEPNEGVSTAAPITMADTGPAAICANSDGSEDHDFYKFTVPPMTTSAMIQISFTNSIGDLDLRLYDTTGSAISQSRGFGNTETITCPGSSPPCIQLTAGDYVFEVFPAVAGAVNNYTISLLLTP
jgi:hypothetical protein